MKILWMPQAIEDLSNVRRYIALDNPQAAKKTVRAIVDKIDEQHVLFPESGRDGRIAGTREFVIVRTPFVVPYRVNGDVIEILGVHHASLPWPERFD